MPTALALERIRPCLFERLIDFAPEQHQEAMSERVLSMSRYREGVIRDLEWLLNAGSHLPSEGLQEFPHVERSVFNYGRPDLAGVALSRLSPTDLEAELAKAIRRFEPRIVPETLKVRCVTTEGSKDSRRFKRRGAFNCLTFEIKGELWAQPVSEEFLFRTTLDLETGTQPL